MGLTQVQHGTCVKVSLLAILPGAPALKPDVGLAFKSYAHLACRAEFAAGFEKKSAVAPQDRPRGAGRGNTKLFPPHQASILVPHAFIQV